MKLLFETTVRDDGLAYINPLPGGHWLYTLRDRLASLGQKIDRILFGDSGR